MCRELFKDEMGPMERGGDEQHTHDIGMLLYAQTDVEYEYWWQIAAQTVVLLSGAITILRFLALLFPTVIERIFHHQIEAGKHLNVYIAPLLRKVMTALPTLVFGTLIWA